MSWGVLHTKIGPSPLIYRICPHTQRLKLLYAFYVVANSERRMKIVEPGASVCTVSSSFIPKFYKLYMKILQIL